MSGNEAPELRAYRELEMLVRHLGEELAMFRRRAIAAEAQLKESGSSATAGSAKGSGHDHGKSKQSSGGHAADLEKENRELRTRVERAEDRLRQMMDRIRFLRQQMQVQSPGAAASRSA